VNAPCTIPESAFPLAADPLAPVNGLLGLWDMLDRYGLLFARAFSALADAKVLCFPIKIPEGAREVSDKEIAYGVALGLDLMKEACVACGMTGVIPELDRIAILIAPQTMAPRLGISQAIVHLLSRVKDDLNAQKFFHVLPGYVQFYGQDQLFGDVVAKKFPSASEDIKNAGNCLALGQATACIFHLMRAMEIAVRQLSRRLNVTITPQTTWRVMTGNMDPKIKAMPDATQRQKQKKNDWEAARTNLHLVGSVWRNNTMHPATSYTQSQALDVMNAVRVFMSGLSAL
jgi:hypothetical protein